MFAHAQAHLHSNGLVEHAQAALHARQAAIPRRAQGGAEPEEAERAMAGSTILRGPKVAKRPKKPSEPRPARTGFGGNPQEQVAQHDFSG